VEHDAQQGVVDGEPAVISNKSQALKFLHKEIDIGARDARERRQFLTRNPGQESFGLGRHTVAREQQQRAREPFLMMVEQLFEEIFLDPYVRAEHVGDKAIREVGLLVKKPKHFLFLDHQDPAGDLRGRVPHANRLAGQAPLAEELSGAKHGDDRLSPGLCTDRQFHAAFLNVHDARARVALHEDRRAAWIRHTLGRDAR
jgi:hypothetical protein